MNSVPKKVFPLDGPVTQELPRGQPGFSDIAGRTGRHEITRRTIALLHAWLYMIQRQISFAVHLTAIDAPVPVALKNDGATICRAT